MMVQTSPCALLFWGLLGCVWVLPVLIAPSSPTLCTSLRTLNTNLTQRRRYMKHNFPINYTIRVHYEEVFKPRNITRLKSQVEGLEAQDLQEVWLLVNKEVLKHILRVLPERHPSYRYTFSLQDLFLKVQQVLPSPDEWEPPERIQEICDRVKDPDYPGWTFVTPKSLLDNFYRTMRCLFSDCFSIQYPEEPNYCNVSHLLRHKSEHQT
ncbi:interleukin-34 [Hypomesus transpacificus]|uniref:interleukin-34 n=1 Tax=Hypomesus transpacificus TaxID=137520 RepID=UPI001F074AC6|nr:interleukin-34 [Hypomesus transpacificus]